jgi:predicted DNA-binding ribbon-helix-helix protein
VSDIRKRSITLAGHRTSYSIEDQFQDILTEMAAEQAVPLAALIARIDSLRGSRSNLSSALRLAVLDYLLEKRSH